MERQKYSIREFLCNRIYLESVFFEFHFVSFVSSRANVENALSNMADEFYFQLNPFESELSIILIFLY